MDSTPRSDSEEESNRWIDPRRPLTATNRVSGGLAGGEIIRPRGGKIRRRPSPSAMIDLSGGVRGDRPAWRYGNLRRHNFPTAMTDGSGGVGGSGKISPSHSSTAMTDRSGGGAGGGKISPSHSSTSSLPITKPMMIANQPAGTRFFYRHPPIGNTSTDPYWIRGGLQRLTTVHYIGGGGNGGVEEENVEYEAELDAVSPMSMFPFKVSTESWEAAEAEQWMIREGLLRYTQFVDW